MTATQETGPRPGSERGFLELRPCWSLYSHLSTQETAESIGYPKILYTAAYMTPALAPCE